MGPVYGDAVEVPARAERRPRSRCHPLHDRLQSLRQVVRRRLPEHAFIASVQHLADQHQLDLSVLHGDGTNTVAKKGGDGIGYSGHKHQKGEKVIAIIDNNGYVLAPLPVAPVNKADTVLFPQGLKA
jgi:hypothetical protein